MNTFNSIARLFHSDAFGHQHDSADEKMERIERIKAAQSRRDAGAARANIGGGGQVAQIFDEGMPLVSKATVFTKLRGLPTIGAPFRVIHEHIEQKRIQRKLEQEGEARRVWDMLQVLEPGTRVKLKGLKSKYGGIDYNNKLATVQAGIGNRFSVKLDLLEKDGAVREGQGAEIKIGLQNMVIWDAEVESILAAEEFAAKEAARKERDQAMKDLLSLRFRKLLPAIVRSNEVARTDLISTEKVNNLGLRSRIEYQDLGPESTVESLRTFHHQEGFKGKIGKWDTGKEIFEKIQHEWNERIECLKRADRDFKDAEAAIRVGSLQPAVRNDNQVFVLNASFSFSYQALTQCRKRLLNFFSHVIQQGNVRGASLIALEIRLDYMIAPDKGGPSDVSETYIGNTLVITQGRGQGQDAIICSYDGETRTAGLSIWNVAVPDSSSAYELLGSELHPFHYKGRSRGCTLDAFIMASDADAQSGFYCGLMLRIVSGPGRYQVAIVLKYDGERKVAVIGKWRYDKSLFKQVLDQDDENIIIVMPTNESNYEVEQLDPKSNRSMSLHLKGRLVQGSIDSLFLSTRASENDVYTGKGIVISKGPGWGQKARITSYLGAKRLVTIDAWQLAIPNEASKYSVLMMPRDQEIFGLYQMLQAERETAAQKVASLDAARKRKIRARFRAAARTALWTEQAGEKILETRRKDNASSWEYYGEAQAKRMDATDAEHVNERSVSWSNIALDASFLNEVDITNSETETLIQALDSGILREEIVLCNGHLLQAPIYSKMQRNRDGSVEQPIQLLDVATGQVVFDGPSHDWTTWKSLLEESSPVRGRSDVFLWKGRTVLQPVTSLGDEGEDVFTLVDEVSGMLLYCGPHLEAEREREPLADCHLSSASDSAVCFDTVRTIAGRDGEIPRTGATISAAGTGRDSFLLLALNKSRVGRMSQEIEESEDKIRKAHEHLGEVDVDDSGKVEDGQGSAHAVGGQIWESTDDALLWKSLLEESVCLPERPDVFLWRDLTILQPTRQGEYQRVLTETGDLVFYGLNPNETIDFPSRKNAVGVTRNAASRNIVRETISLDHGIYSGAVCEGRFEGEGTFSVMFLFICDLTSFCFSISRTDGDLRPGAHVLDSFH
jgi:hypothetical protein